MEDLIYKKDALRVIFDSVGKPATEIYQKVRELPGAEAVTVVHCRECENWQTDWEPNYSRGDEHFCAVACQVTGGHFYCADGERRKET